MYVFNEMITESAVESEMLLFLYKAEFLYVGCFAMFYVLQNFR